MFGFTDEEMKIFEALDAPQKIQDFIENIPINFEENGDTCKSPRMVLRTNSAHCIEGAMLAAAALRMNGFKPLVVDMTAANFDFDHVIAIFRQDGFCGAISKTNHAVLRYREPIYRSVRELVMSYFHEYFNSDGKKALRSYSMPVNLARFDPLGWMTSEDDVWYIPVHLSKVRHYRIVNKSQIAKFRSPHELEIEAGNLVQWKTNGTSPNMPSQ